jgi:hypothetical protein
MIEAVILDAREVRDQLIDAQLFGSAVCHDAKAHESFSF